MLMRLSSRVRPEERLLAKRTVATEINQLAVDFQNVGNGYTDQATRIVTRLEGQGLCT